MSLKGQSSFQTIDLIIPFFNPQRGWDHHLISVSKELSHLNIHWILVNDGSKHAYEEEHDRLTRTFKDISWVTCTDNGGKGSALREGIKHCKNQLTFYTDVDFPYRTYDLKCMINKLNTCDVVAGVRSKDYYEKIPMFRSILSKTFRKILRFFLFWPIDDTQCGIKGFKSEHNALFSKTRTKRYLIDIDFLRACYKEGLIIEPVDVVLRIPIDQSEISIKTVLSESKNLLKIFLR